MIVSVIQIVFRLSLIIMKHCLICLTINAEVAFVNVINLHHTWDWLEPLHALADLDLDCGGRGGGGLESAHRVGQVGAVPVGGAG